MLSPRCTALCLALAAFSCAPDAPVRVQQPLKLPGAGTPMQVTGVATRGPYMDAILEHPQTTMRFFFANEGSCAEIIRSEAQVEWVSEGPIGVVRLGETRCDPAGIGTLRVWRDRRPRARSGDPVPRGRANFRVVYEDEEVVMARGRFPYANRVGWAGGYDTIAVIPNTEICRPIIERGVGTIEFRPSGNEPFRLVTGEGLCPVDGFVRPIPGL